ncbi:glycoside hydrolase family 88 protein [Dysgonomonas macrotermitis]|uniref:Glycosyl Hydrolase Family 88 n=1 Tax=Dysgonomonas macrotermitis TaxID=1346286 RepID=A0A1M4XCA0_9BACT|nr:glycoside hydrolase family 88 protein [Dysgonomonas macrotermitis]SHE91148.1 Glycosyl Hydrolase Family 88 [Dysgonomonas macrotermitis]
MKYILIVNLIIISFLSCKSTKSQEDIVAKDFGFAEKQFDFALTEIDQALSNDSTAAFKRLVSPRTIKPDGTLGMVASKDWCSGFFPGSLWYMYEYTKDKKWEVLARKFTDSIEREKINGGTHDMGFKMYCSFGNGLRLTHDTRYKDILLESAYTLITRYKPNAKIIRSWDHNTDKWQCPVIIDNMMNLELLFWAFKESKDSIFYHIAVNHAKTTMKNHFRSDYSTYHVIDYDSITGEVLKKNTHQGYAHESTWARGEAWAIYGYTMAYRETHLPEFLNQAKHVANFIFNNPNLPEDLIPYWDYNAPDIPNEPRDVSAATVTASALYELSQYDKANRDKYKEWADKIIENLSKHYLAKQGSDRGFLLLHSTGSKPMDSEVDVPLSYADYYFLEALLRKQKLEHNENLF